MLGVADYGSFVIAVIVFLMIPGPGNLALITSTGKGGVRGGLAATLGVIAGDQVLMWLAVAGVATLLAAWPPAFYAVQWLGAAYLAWLGLRMILASPVTRRYSPSCRTTTCARRSRSRCSTRRRSSSTWRSSRCSSTRRSIAAW